MKRIPPYTQLGIFLTGHISFALRNFLTVTNLPIVKFRMPEDLIFCLF